jgi:hypothetical protein
MTSALANGGIAEASWSFLTSFPKPETSILTKNVLFQRVTLETKCLL